MSASKKIIAAESELCIIPLDTLTLNKMTVNGSNDLGGMSYL